jgi:hypothetical protein
MHNVMNIITNIWEDKPFTDLEPCTLMLMTVSPKHCNMAPIVATDEKCRFVRSAQTKHQNMRKPRYVSITDELIAERSTVPIFDLFPRAKSKTKSMPSTMIDDMDISKED